MTSEALRLTDPWPPILLSGKMLGIAQPLSINPVDPSRT
jgi:hypothetical protein